MAGIISKIPKGIAIAKKGWGKASNIEKMKQRFGKFEKPSKVWDSKEKKVPATYESLDDYFKNREKMKYFAENYRLEKAGGGLANLTRTVAPDSGPVSRGLRSLYIDDMD